MGTTAEIALLAIFYMLTKHVVADYFLQNGYMICNKGRYGHPGGLMHALLHAALTVPVYLILPPESPTIGAAIVGSEFFVHYHLDWAKDLVTKRAGWQPCDKAYWVAFGVDQYLHVLTCFVIVGYLAL